MAGYQHEFRCGGCRRMLCKSDSEAVLSRLSIKCPRCGAINHLGPASPLPQRQEREEKGPSCGSISPKKT